MASNNLYMMARMMHGAKEDSDQDDAQRSSSSEEDSSHCSNDVKASRESLKFPMRRVAADEESGVENESYDDDEEAQLSGKDDEEEEEPSSSCTGCTVASMAHVNWQDNNGESNVSSGEWHTDDDEESQVSQPPQVVEVNLPRKDVHVNDAAAINSILDSISDPATKAVLESIIEDPENAHQHNGYDEYINQPDPSQHSWTPIDVLYNGLFYAGFDMKRLNKNNLKRKTAWFKTFYGVEHTTMSPYLIDLRKEYPDIDYKVCFITFNWMTLYEVYPVLSARWKRSEEYIGSKIIECCMKMADFARNKIIRFALKHPVEIGRTLDCANFMIQEMRQDPHTKWFDWKTHSAGLVSYCYFG